jgi:hypothetical protein
MRSLLLTSLGFLLIAAAAASAEDVELKIPETKIILAMQAAVRADDRQWFAAHLHLPVRYYGKTKGTISSKEWFLSLYATIIGSELKAAILAQDPETYLKNYQGLMVGEGSRISGAGNLTIRAPAWPRATKSSPSTIASRSIRE